MQNHTDPKLLNRICSERFNIFIWHKMCIFKFLKATTLISSNDTWDAMAKTLKRLLKFEFSNWIFTLSTFKSWLNKIAILQDEGGLEKQCEQCTQQVLWSKSLPILFPRYSIFHTHTNLQQVSQGCYTFSLCIWPSNNTYYILKWHCIYLENIFI